MPLQLGNGAAYVRLQGLTFEGATGSSTTNVYASGSAHDIELSNCEVRNSQRQGFFSDPRRARSRSSAARSTTTAAAAPRSSTTRVPAGYGHLLANSRISNAPIGFNVQIYPSATGSSSPRTRSSAPCRDGIIVGSDGGGTTTNLTIVNNVIAYNGRYGVYSFWGGSVGTGNLATTNVAWGNSYGHLVGTRDHLHREHDRRPPLRGSRAGQLPPAAGQPGIDTALIGYALPDDLDGAGRPQGVGPDIGSYER